MWSYIDTIIGDRIANMHSISIQSSKSLWIILNNDYGKFVWMKFETDNQPYAFY